MDEGVPLFPVSAELAVVYVALPLPRALPLHTPQPPSQLDPPLLCSKFHPINSISFQLDSLCATSSMSREVNICWNKSLLKELYLLVPLSQIGNKQRSGLHTI